MTHLPTGLTQTAVGRSKDSNIQDARKRLEEMLDELETSEYHHATNTIRSKQLGSGQRGDKRRTYRFQDDRVADHETGKSARCSDIMRGNLELLW